MTLRSLVLCADDFALSPGVSRAIIELLERGRLSATSCMTVSRAWPEHARALKPLAGYVDVGLHLTLTALEPLSRAPRLTVQNRLPGLGRLIRDAFLGQLDPDELRTELAHQFDAFEQVWGAPPDFVDGHQHVHILPGIRDIVLDLTSSRAPDAYVRQCWEPITWVLRRGIAVPRAALIAKLSRPLARRLSGRRANDSFRGVTSFRHHETFPEQFRRYLVGPGERPLIMCHPGHMDDLLPRLDPVTHQREIERDYFLSPGFPADIAAAGYRLARMP